MHNKPSDSGKDYLYRFGQQWRFQNIRISTIVNKVIQQDTSALKAKRPAVKSLWHALIRKLYKPCQGYVNVSSEQQTLSEIVWLKFYCILLKLVWGLRFIVWLNFRKNVFHWSLDQAVVDYPEDANHIDEIIKQTSDMYATDV